MSEPKSEAGFAVVDRLVLFATNTGLAKLKEGNLDDAIETFQRAVQLDPTNAQAYYNLAKALQKKGQREAARTAERKARELDSRIKPLPK